MMRNKIVKFAFVALLGVGLMSCAKLEARDDLQKGARHLRPVSIGSSLLLSGSLQAGS